MILVQNSALVKLYGEILREIIGSRLREERERLGLSQNELATIGGASKRSQIDWEQGKSVPNAEYLALISNAGLDVFYIVTGKFVGGALSKDETDVVVGFRALDLRGKAGVMALLSGLSLTETTPKAAFYGNVGQVVEGNLSTESLSFTVGNKKRE